MSKTPIERWVEDIVGRLDRLRAERNTGHRRGALDDRIARLRAERGYIECDVCGTTIPPGEVCSECGWGVNEHPVVD